MVALGPIPPQDADVSLKHSWRYILLYFLVPLFGSLVSGYLFYFFITFNDYTWTLPCVSLDPGERPLEEQVCLWSPLAPETLTTGREFR